MKHHLLLGAISVALYAGAADNVFNIDMDNIGAEVQPTMYGLFFEDINFAADGGLYGELVKNRSFEFPQNFMGWNILGNVTLMEDGPFERNPHYVRLSYPGHPGRLTGLENEGFFGIGVKQDNEYRFSVRARTVDSDSTKITVQLVDKSSKRTNPVLASTSITVHGKEWAKYTAILRPDQTIDKATLRVLLSKPEQSADLEHISLFPVDTWNGHENGLRRDLVEMLAAIKPGVLRFPGGCIVEGADLPTRYQWKNTVGEVENRPLNENRWNYCHNNRYYPDYFQSYGLGFYEYFLLAEEIGASPLPILNAGMKCQYQNRPDDQLPLDSIRQYIQDALDLIEFANGDTTTTWGALRADMGHPEPFNMKYLGIGNEQWTEIYPRNLEAFIKEIRAAYPDIKIVGSSGPKSDGKEFDYLWPEMTRLGADLVDEHFYRPEEWFLKQGARYDNYDRNGPKVFAGEYACHIRDKKENNFRAAILEAALMTGFERNADVVHMTSYAPLFAHVDGWQWRPDLIWFDNLNTMPTTSFHVQKLYGNYKGDNVVPLTMVGKPVTGAEGQNGLFASAVIEKDSHRLIVKVVNTGYESQEITLNINGVDSPIKSGKVISLTSDEPMAENTIGHPDMIKPVVSPIAINGKDFTTMIPGNSFCLYLFDL
ncbi:MAG: carbohydrate binding domain-containing protein [Duncaniella sp.]|nr:carbohydrate binding domain-containing protein [Duncaniella sp.]